MNVHIPERGQHQLPFGIGSIGFGIIGQHSFDLPVLDLDPEKAGFGSDHLSVFIYETRFEPHIF